MPLKKEFDAFKAVPHMRQFVLDDFITSFQQSTPHHMPNQHGLKGDWSALYRRFVEQSPSFTAWLEQRRADIGVELKHQHMEMLCSVDFTSVEMAQRGAVEVVDLVLKMKDRLNCIDGGLEEKQRRRLKGQLQRLVESVEDEELKAVLLSNGGLLMDAFE